MTGPGIDDVPDDVPEPHYQANPAKTRDQMEGRADDPTKVDPEGLPGMDDSSPGTRGHRQSFALFALAPDPLSL